MSNKKKERERGDQNLKEKCFFVPVPLSFFAVAECDSAGSRALESVDAWTGEWCEEMRLPYTNFLPSHTHTDALNKQN